MSIDRRRRLALAGLAAVLFAAFATAVALAQSDLGGKIRGGNEVRIPAGETISTDLYIFGGTVVIDGTVDGDVVASGGTVSINGPVTGDVLAAAGTLRIGGQVTGDVRVAGGQVTIDGSVGEDALAAGGQIDVSGTVGEDLILGGGQATVAGSVGGSITGSAGTYSRSGSVGGTDDVTIQEQAPVVTRATDQVLDAVQHFVAVLLVGLLALWLAPRTVAAAESFVRAKPVEAAFWGVIALVGLIGLCIVILIVVILVAVILGAVGLDLLAALEVLFGVVAITALSLIYAFAAAFLADVIVGLALALLVDRDGDSARTGGRLPPRLIGLLALGSAVVVVVTSLPVIGGPLRFVVVVLGTGALLAAIWRWWRPRSAPVPVPEVVGA